MKLKFISYYTTSMGLSLYEIIPRTVMLDSQDVPWNLASVDTNIALEVATR
jgi:hypothetical protein